MADEISLSLYTDFLLARGGARVSAVQATKREPFDAYAAFKDAAKAVASGKRPDAFKTLLAGLDASDRRKRLYGPRVKGFERFLAKTSGVWVTPPEARLDLGMGYAVHVNPEIALNIDGAPVAIKLYCRKDPLEAERVEQVCSILWAAFGPGWAPAVLDVKAGKLRREKRVPRLERGALAARAEGLAFAAIHRARGA